MMIFISIFNHWLKVGPIAFILFDGLFSKHIVFPEEPVWLFNCELAVASQLVILTLGIPIS